MTKSNETQQRIFETAKEMFATGGYENVSIRNVAYKISISPSVIYHYYPTKDAMLEGIFETVRKDLGVKRQEVIKDESPKEMLRTRITFQFDNAIDVIYILKYYAHYREEFIKNSQGFVPKEAYTHIKEVLEAGVEVGEFEGHDVDGEAKVITHAINGFVLEYYPQIPEGQERVDLINTITDFIYRGIKKKGGE